MNLASQTKTTARAIYIAAFFFGVHYTLLAYAVSTYLRDFIPLDLIGILYIVANIATIFALYKLSPILRKFGNGRVTHSVIVLAIIALATLAFFKNPFLIAIFFIAHTVLVAIGVINFDIFLEETTDRNVSGKIRGIYLTVVNISWFLSPLLASTILNEAATNFGAIFLTSILFLIVALVIVHSRLEHIPDVAYERAPFWASLKGVWKNKNIFRIFISSFALQFFFATMVIYSPLYLQDIGFTWDQIGPIFTIMLIPFVILELPLGLIADRFLGEKELLVAGLLVMGIASIGAAFLTTPNFILWALLLLVSRIGASTIEIMSQTYFFKKVSPEQSNELELLHDTRPLSYVIAPFVASIVLSFTDLRFLFLVLGLVVLASLPFAARLKDTR